jgi:UDP-N-acetylglucosamine 4-epimerase
VEVLLGLGQKVVGLDDFSAGHRKNLDQVRARLPEAFASQFRFVEGSSCDRRACDQALKGVEIVLHQAALSSVPRSLEEPVRSADANILGFFQLLDAARNAGINRVVYASSSSVYGDDPTMPKKEYAAGPVLSPYALTKWVNEETAGLFHRAYGTECIGLRYFNVFGERQDPKGAYAAVIPLWLEAMMDGSPVFVNGDGETTRDFCYVQDVVQANLLAATVADSGALNTVYNVACGRRTSLNELAELLWAELSAARPGLTPLRISRRNFRAGDIRHSVADITKAEKQLGYQPEFSLAEGLRKYVRWSAGERG